MAPSRRECLTDHNLLSCTEKPLSNERVAGSQSENLAFIRGFVRWPYASTIDRELSSRFSAKPAIRVPQAKEQMRKVLEYEPAHA
jgi:hypothetical protein